MSHIHIIDWPDHALHKILFVSNDKKSTETLKQIKNPDWMVICANNSDDALKFLANEQFDVVIADLECKPLDGLQLLKKIHKNDSLIQRVLLSSKNHAQVILDAIEEHVAHRFVSKPIDIHKVTKALTKSIKNYSQKCERFDIVNRKLEPLRKKLVHHELYNLIDTADKLRIFLEHHCYAVWDFMCLLKTLQNKLTCTNIPWYAVENIQAARMINEIVIAEETDVLPGGGYASHFDMYIMAMQQLHADTDICVRFTDLIKEKMHWRNAIEQGQIPEPAKKFVERTLNICENHPIYEVAAYFLFGRENLIPDMFREIVKNISQHENINCSYFLYYLERHIDVDEQEHGPASVAMLNSLCGNDDTRWRLVEKASRDALQARLELWDGIAADIKKINLFKATSVIYKAN